MNIEALNKRIHERGGPLLSPAMTSVSASLGLVRITWRLPSRTAGRLIRWFLDQGQVTIVEEWQDQYEITIRETDLNAILGGARDKKVSRSRSPLERKDT